LTTIWTKPIISTINKRWTIVQYVVVTRDMIIGCIMTRICTRCKDTTWIIWVHNTETRYGITITSQPMIITRINITILMLLLTTLIWANSIIANPIILFNKALWIDIKMTWIIYIMDSIPRWTATTTEYRIKYILMAASLFSPIIIILAHFLLKVSIINTIPI
jgi:hypothetical protein